MVSRGGPLSMEVYVTNCLLMPAVLEEVLFSSFEATTGMQTLLTTVKPLDTQRVPNGQRPTTCAEKPKPCLLTNFLDIVRIL